MILFLNSWRYKLNSNNYSFVLNRVTALLQLAWIFEQFMEQNYKNAVTNSISYAHYIILLYSLHQINVKAFISYGLVYFPTQVHKTLYILHNTVNTFKFVSVIFFRFFLNFLHCIFNLTNFKTHWMDKTTQSLRRKHSKLNDKNENNKGCDQKWDNQKLMCQQNEITLQFMNTNQELE